MAGISRALALVCIVAAVNCVSVGFDSAQMGTLNNMPAYKAYFGLNATTMGLNVSVMNLGSIFAGLFAGQLVDKWGRKVGMYSAAGVTIIGAIIQGTSTTLAQFMVGRVVLGIASTINTTSVPPYLAEMAPPGKRGFIAGFYWANWLLGSILAASIGLGTFHLTSTWSWRILSLVQMGPGLLCAVIVPFIPESPRWLVGQDRHEEAAAVLARFHAGGDFQAPLVLAEMKEITETIALEKAENAVTWKVWLRNFWTHRGNQRRALTLLLLGVFEQTVGSSLITYYLSSVLTLVGITDTKTKLSINLGVTAFAFCSAIAGVCVVDKAGRKKMMYFGSLWCAACLCVMAGLTSSPLKGANTSRQIGVVAMVFLFQFGYSSTWTPISFSYCAEVLNFSIRAKGMAIYHMITSSAGFVNQWLIPIGLANITWRFYIIGIVWNVFMCIVIYYVFVETKQLSLEEIDQLFNGLKRSEIVTLDEVVKGGKLDLIDGRPPYDENDEATATTKAGEVVTSKVASA